MARSEDPQTLQQDSSGPPIKVGLRSACPGLSAAARVIYSFCIAYTEKFEKVGRHSRRQAIHQTVHQTAHHGLTRILIMLETQDAPPSSTWITIMPSAITDLGINLFQATGKPRV